MRIEVSPRHRVSSDPFDLPPRDDRPEPVPEARGDEPVERRSERGRHQRLRAPPEDEYTGVDRRRWDKRAT